MTLYHFFYLSLLRERVLDLLLIILSLILPIRGRGEGLLYFLGSGDLLATRFGEGLHLAAEEGGDTEGRCWATFLSRSREQLADRFRLSGDLALFLEPDTDLFLSLSYLSPLSLERLLDFLLFFDLFFTTGERLLDLFSSFNSFGERLLRLFLCFSLLSGLLGGEWLFDLFLCFFRGGDLLLEREDLLGDLDMALLSK